MSSGVTGEAATFNRYFPKDHGGLGLLAPDELPGNGYMSVAVHLAEVERVRADERAEVIEECAEAVEGRYAKVLTVWVSTVARTIRSLGAATEDGGAK